jgi:hypothetical protein
VKKSDWNNTQMFSADVAETVARLKRDSAKDIFCSAAPISPIA